MTEILVNPGENRVRDLEDSRWLEIGFCFRLCGTWLGVEGPHTRNPMITFFAPYLPCTCLSLCCSVRRASSEVISCLIHRSSPSFLIDPGLFVPSPAFFRVRVCVHTCVPLHILALIRSFPTLLFCPTEEDPIVVSSFVLPPWIPLRLHH